MSGGGRSSSTTVERADPWVGQQPYLREAFAEAQRLYRAPGPHYFPGATVAPFAPETELALNAMAARGLAGSPYLRAAGGELERTLGGDYLAAGNPHLGAVADRLWRQVAPRVDSRFAAAGRYRSGAHAGTLASAYADALAPYAFQEHAAERDRMAEAARLAPALAAQDHADLAQLAAAGRERERLQQALINDRIARFNHAQQLPYEKLAQYLALVQGSYGGTRTTTQPQSPGQSFLGGAATGAGLGATLGHPWLGAGLGGLLSLL